MSNIYSAAIRSVLQCRFQYRFFVISIWILFFCYLFVMDFVLIVKIRSRKELSSNSTRKSSEIFGSLTVKKILIGPIVSFDLFFWIEQHYFSFQIQFVHSPIAERLETNFHLTRHFPWLSANFISIFHSFLALISIKLLSNENLSQRRIGVVIFQLRNFFDCLDGVIFRAQTNKTRYTSYYGEFGYFVDCFSDTFAGICLIIGSSIFLVRRFENDRKIRQSIVFFAVFYGLIAISWNRIVRVYDQLFDSNSSTNRQKQNQFIEIFLRTPLTISIFYLWRYISALSFQDYLLGAIFFDRISVCFSFIEKKIHFKQIFI